jgi:cellulose biosynthesis protein BcsE
MGKNQNCTVLVVNPGSNNDKLFSLLMGNIVLFSVWQVSVTRPTVFFTILLSGVMKKGECRQQLTLKLIEGKWHVAQQEETVVQPRSDEKRILSHIAVLEGAPALSENWSLFETNEALFNEARTTQAATIVFSLMQNNQIETLARQIHTLRRQRGSALKIVVRENNTSLRATDERLLLGCGANMVVPWNAPLSRCLTLIESIQGQQFNRHVPEDISTLLSMTQPMKLRGYQNGIPSAMPLAT